MERGSGISFLLVVCTTYIQLLPFPGIIGVHGAPKTPRYPPQSVEGSLGYQSPAAVGLIREHFMAMPWSMFADRKPSKFVKRHASGGNRLQKRLARDFVFDMEEFMRFSGDRGKRNHQKGLDDFGYSLNEDENSASGEMEHRQVPNESEERLELQNADEVGPPDQDMDEREEKPSEMDQDERAQDRKGEMMPVHVRDLLRRKPSPQKPKSDYPPLASAVLFDTTAVKRQPQARPRSGLGHWKHWKVLSGNRSGRLYQKLENRRRLRKMRTQGGVQHAFRHYGHRKRASPANIKEWFPKKEETERRRPLTHGAQFRRHMPLLKIISGLLTNTDS